MHVLLMFRRGARGNSGANMSLHSPGYQNKKKAIMKLRPSGVEEFDPPTLTSKKASEYPGILPQLACRRSHKNLLSVLVQLFAPGCDMMWLRQSHHSSRYRSGTFAPVDSSVNEVYAYHGTQVRYALAIAENVPGSESSVTSLSDAASVATSLREAMCRHSGSISRDPAQGHYTVEGHILANLSARLAISVV